jgi:DNA-binding MarR family transcriptional regulator
VPPTEPDDSLPEAFWAVARRLRQVTREALAPWDITPAQSRALGTLLRHGPLRLSELAEQLRIAPRSATEVIDALQAHALVERQPDPSDRRAVLVGLTAKGTEVAAAIRSSRDAGAAGFFARLEEHDRAELSRILGTLRG